MKAKLQNFSDDDGDWIWTSLLKPAGGTDLLPFQPSLHTLDYFEHSILCNFYVFRQLWASAQIAVPGHSMLVPERCCECQRALGFCRRADHC
jgi:hypothetical protein